MADTTRLPGPWAETWDWKVRAACRGLDSDLFFHPEQERGEQRDTRDAAAKAVCRRCPVLAQCRAHALAVEEPYGVWGGMTATERLAELVRLGRRSIRRVQATT